MVKTIVCLNILSLDLTGVQVMTAAPGNVPEILHVSRVKEPVSMMKTVSESTLAAGQAVRMNGCFQNNFIQTIMVLWDSQLCMRVASLMTGTEKYFKGSFLAKIFKDVVPKCFQMEVEVI